MSGFSMSYTVLTAGALKAALANVPDDMPVLVPSINRRPGEFIPADHVFVDSKENYLSIDGDIAEAKAKS